MKNPISSLKHALAALVLLLFLFFAACDYLHKPDIKSGAKVFEKNCVTCHNFQQDGIGPQLGGLKAEDKPYLLQFIKSPKAMVDSKHPRATALYTKFGKLMPDFGSLSEADRQDVIAYVLAQPAPANATADVGSQNPIPEAIEKGPLPLHLQKVLQFPYTNEKQPRTRVNKMAIHPITRETMISDLQGKIYFLNARNELSVYFDAQRSFKDFVNNPGLGTGLGSFAFHPDFAKNKRLYMTHTEPANTTKADFAYGEDIPVKLQWILDEWTVDDPNAKELKGSHRELMRINVVNVIHGMQEIAFNPLAKPSDEDYGLLYIGMGDGGAVERGHPEIPRDINHIWGKVLRIDPLGNNSQNGKYGIPKTNPLVGKEGLKEVFAFGFRNPNHISWLKDGRIIVSNIGQRQVESLYLLKPGRNYGWPDREGTFAIPKVSNVNLIGPLPPDDAKFGYTYPIAQFDHDEGNAIMGGFEYTGKAVPQLQGKYIFGEIVRGRVFYIDLKEIKEGTQTRIHEFPLILDGQATTLKEQCKQDKVDLRIGRDAEGEMYIMTKSDGLMYKIVK